MIETFYGGLEFLSETLMYFGPIGAMIPIIVEALLPVLPLGFFVTLNMYTFGNLFGIILSWIATIIGCLLSYYVFIVLKKKILMKVLKEKSKMKLLKMEDHFSNIKFSKLVLLMSLPFIPSFLINVASGFSKIKITKFFCALVIGKIFIIIFWGFIGKTFIDSIQNIRTMITLGVMLVVAYLLSKLVEKKTKIDVR